VRSRSTRSDEVVHQEVDGSIASGWSGGFKPRGNPLQGTRQLREACHPAALAAEARPLARASPELAFRSFGLNVYHRWLCLGLLPRWIGVA
jgi:hypothetical protein